MEIAALLLLVLIASLLVIVAAIQPPRAHVSEFELKRRAGQGDKAAQIDQRREKAYFDIVSIQRVAISLLLTMFTAASIATYGFGFGILLGVLAAVAYTPLGRIKLLHQYAKRLYIEQEQNVISFVEKYRSYVWWLRGVSLVKMSAAVHSRDELQHLIQTTHALNDDSQKRLVTNALLFHERTIDEIMTPRDKLVTIKKSEILGPLVLDDLYKSGHQSFPVINGDLDSIVGILRLADVSTLDTARKHTSLVETAMRKQVHKVGRNEPLSEALEKLLSSHEHILLITDDADSVVGLVTLADIMRKLFGSKA